MESRPRVNLGYSMDNQREVANGEETVYDGADHRVFAAGGSAAGEQPARDKLNATV